MDKLKVGILGCGGITQIAHLPAFAVAERAQAVAVCDVDEELAAAFASRHDVPKVYATYDDMLADADVEAVLVATAHEVHAAHSIAAMEAGKHVLVEKPLAASAKEARAMVEASRRTGLKLQMACMKRHDPALRAAQEFAREKIGGHLLVSAWCLDGSYHMRYLDHLGKAPVRGKRQAAGHKFADRHELYVAGYAVHDIDLLLWFGGPVAKVLASGTQRDQRVVCAAVLEFASGARGTLQILGWREGHWKEGIFVEGAGGSVHIEVPFPYFHRTSRVAAFDGATGRECTPTFPGCDQYAAQLDYFAAAVRDDLPADPSGEDGLAAQAVIEAILNSMRTGSPQPVEQV